MAEESTITGSQRSTVAEYTLKYMQNTCTLKNTVLNIWTVHHVYNIEHFGFQLYPCTVQVIFSLDQTLTNK